MKLTLPLFVIGFALLSPAQAADVTAKISDVHLCCKNCVTGVEKAIAEVPGATAAVDKDAGTVELTGSDQATVQKAADALVAAGYFGKSANPDVKISRATGAKNRKVQSLQVSGVHLCCGKCVKAVNEALKSVPGVTGDTAEKNAKTFEVTGDFNEREAFAALQKAGFTGKVGK
jgi:copper chaperone CopZ